MEDQELLIPVAADEYWEQGVSQGIYGYINTKGEMVIPPQFSSAGYFENGFARVGFGFFTVVSHEPDPFDEPESSLINPKGEIVKTFKDQSLPYRFTDNKLEVLIPELMQYHDGLCLVQKEGRAVYVNPAGDIKITLPEEYAGRPFSDGMALIYGIKSREHGFIDTTGEIIVKPQYKEAEPFSEGIAVVRKHDNKYLFIDKKGEKIFENEFDHARSFSSGLAPAIIWEENSNQGLYGYIDTSGKWVIDPAYKMAEAFTDGYALVADYEAEEGYTYYFVNTKGENTFKRMFKTAAPFYKKHSHVTYQDPETEEFSIIKAVMDTNGKNIWDSKNYTPPERDPLLDM